MSFSWNGEGLALAAFEMCRTGYPSDAPESLFLPENTPLTFSESGNRVAAAGWNPTGTLESPNAENPGSTTLLGGAS